MKVLLILPKINSGCQWNVGLACISAVLKKNGHNVELFEMRNYPKDIAVLFGVIQKYNPGVIGITANSHQFHYAKLIARDVKRNFSIPVFIGGVHTILKPQSIEEEDSIDGVCIGEGEFQFLELVNRIESGKPYLDIENFWLRSGKKIIRNKLKPLIGNLDFLPFPDRSIFSYFYNKGVKTPRFIFSRGCPFECTYCCNHAFKKIYKGLGQYMRWRSIDLVLDEIENTRKRYNFDYFKLDDDTFSLNKAWMREFCKRISAKNWGLTFECNIRPGTVNKDDMKFLKEAGCKMIKIGIESGDPNLRKQILNRNFSNEDIIKTFDLAKKFGIKTFSFNIIGAPGETPETVRETVNLNKKIQPDFMQVTAFYPYPMTVLGDLCFKKGYIDKDYEYSYMEKTILKLPTISKGEIENSVKNFKFNVYWSYNKRMALLEKWLQAKKFIIRHPILHKLAKIVYGPFKLIKT